MSPVRVLGAVALCLGMIAAPACSGGQGARLEGPNVIEIDIDDHGLSALWAANAPTIKGWIQNGVLAYSRVDVPTHSNQNNMTLLTGCWPDGTSVPANGWLQRTNYRAPLQLGGLTAGSYIFYDQNPLGARVKSVYSAASAAGLSTAYVGELPPFEHGAGDVHFTIDGATLEGFVVTPDIAKSLFESIFNYPPAVFATFHLDGPPAQGESLVHFTIEDAAALYWAAAGGGPRPPRTLFVWDFLALDDDPTSTYGADGPELVKIVEDYDHALGDLVAAVDAAGYGGMTNYVLTLDHGKVDVHDQVAIEAQLHALVASQGAAHGVGTSDYAILDEDGDGQIYAKVSGAGTDPSTTARQQQIVHGLVELLQGGGIVGLDTSRTMTWDGYLGTRTFRDAHADGPNQADILIFPQDDYTLNDELRTGLPGPFGAKRMYPYGRHGGFSPDELYVPAIFSGPAFKRGVMIPVSIEHVDVAPTALAALGLDGPATRQGHPVYAALAGDPGETVALPADPSTSRALVLANGGFGGTPQLAGPPAGGAIVIDVPGLYAAALRDGGTAGGAGGDAGGVPAALSSFLASGASFEGYETRWRDWPVTEYQLLTGSYPGGAAYVPFAEDDPAMVTIPAMGLFAMPPAAGFIADQNGYQTWHSGSVVYGDQTLFDAAKGLGLTTALLGSPDFQLAHVSTAAIDVLPASGKTLDDVLAMGGRAFVYLAVAPAAGGGPQGVVQAASAAVAQVEGSLAAHGLTRDMLVVLTSRGAAPIDAAEADLYGPGSARRVPLVLAGPNVRAGVTVPGPASPADLAPTVLFALGASTTTDFADGTQAYGGIDPATGRSLPLPHGDRSGRALLRGFTLAAP